MSCKHSDYFGFVQGFLLVFFILISNRLLRLRLSQYLLALHQIDASENDDYLMQLGLLEGRTDDVRCCITVDLCLRLLQKLLDAGITRVRLGILQLDDVGVSYVLIDLALG